ncbi:helix-turn-helix transcriptional regulator [Aeromicrobium sp.]|uniref:helix-turn-helix transcriptional regulator n=1 Tax=Aeromicrobium sp. TaxID=1871063 RepID=UPI0030BCD758
MTARRAIAPDYVDDLLIHIQRGLTVGDAATECGMSRATAYRLLREHKAREARGTDDE